MSEQGSDLHEREGQSNVGARGLGESLGPAASAARVIAPDLPVPDCLDPGIRAYVMILRGVGIETFESCEAGEGHCFRWPTILFHGQRDEGFRALAVALQHALPVRAVARTWSIIDGEPVGPDWEMTFWRAAAAEPPGPPQQAPGDASCDPSETDRSPSASGSEGSERLCEQCLERLAKYASGEYGLLCGLCADDLEPVDDVPLGEVSRGE